MNPRTLFVGSCIALITSAFTFIIRGDILPDLGNAFALSQEDRGWIASGAFWGMAASMLVGAPLCDLLGMKCILSLAFLCHMVGVFGTILAPHNDWAFLVLFGSTFVAGCGNGLVEIAINPLAATLYPDRKTHYLNVLHAWWPGGLVLGGLIARYLGKGIDLGFLKIDGLGYSWQILMGLIAIPGVIYFLICLTQKFPATERVASGVSTGDMFMETFRPMFLLWAFCMLLTAATELGPQQWQESVITRITAGKFSGTMVLIYTSTLMFFLRHFAGPLAHALSPVGMLTVSATLSGIGLYLLSTATTPATVFAFATIFGLGIAYFWPTMLGVTAERFPRGGAWLLGLMGCFGNLSIAAVLPVMGYIYDRESVAAVPTAIKSEAVVAEKANFVLQLGGVPTTEKISTDRVKQMNEADQEGITKAEAQGAAMAFRYVSALPAVLVVVFGLIALRDKALGGYRPEVLMSREEENELFAGGVQGAVE
ncbi:MAG TPA: MFS transporter [Pirellulales bacterium]|jgi:MFS family permease|nr:MFS transporter [Pirellulales bacterium]